MSKKEITQDQLDKLIDDASYLQDEAEALKYVIENVPYNERPPGGHSIAEILLLIDHAQISYYRPILEDALKNNRPIQLNQYEHYEKTFEVDEEKLGDIQKLLSKIAKHRAALVNAIKRVPIIDWEAAIYRDEQDLLLFEFMREMVYMDRVKLKEIADRVLAFMQDARSQRELNQRRSQH
jgi:hypothetical protein